MNSNKKWYGTVIEQQIYFSFTVPMLGTGTLALLFIYM